MNAASLRYKKTGQVHIIVNVECEPDGRWSFMSLRTGRRYKYDSMDQLKQDWEYPERDK